MVCVGASAGCATPQYALRQPPQPVETANILRLEQQISDVQAQMFEEQGARRVTQGERLWGYDLQGMVERLAQVTERPNLPYQAWLVRDKDPNAAALADGRTYITSGMLNYLASRGSDESELAAVLGHELAHTVAQHLVQRVQQVQQQQLLMGLVGAGTALATRDGGESAQQAAQMTKHVAAIINQAILSGYSQEQELEADQLGIRYMMHAGYDPLAALEMLEDFRRFETPTITFLSTHPPTDRRVDDLRRYLTDIGVLASPTAPAPSTSHSIDEQRARLLEAQRLYPAGSVSWQNLQRQLDALD